MVDLFVGVIFTCIGLLFTVIGTIMSFIFEDFFLFIFTFLGLIFLGIGIGLLIKFFKDCNTEKRIIQNGNEVICQITDVRERYDVRINGRHPFVIECCDGENNCYTSKNFIPKHEIREGDFVHVFVLDEQYYVDVDTITEFV